MSVANLIAAGLYSALSGGTALVASLGTTKIYRNQAPDKTTYPFVVYSQYAGGPLNINPSDIRENVYFVRAYGWNDAQVGTIDAQIGSLLHHGTIAVSGYTNITTNREQDFELIENQPSGQPIYMAGGLYRIALDA
jgi:hypothetical protein